MVPESKPEWNRKATPVFSRLSSASHSITNFLTYRVAAAAAGVAAAEAPNPNWHAPSKPSSKTFHTTVIVTSASTTTSRSVSACRKKSTNGLIHAWKLSRNPSGRAIS